MRALSFGSSSSVFEKEAEQANSAATASKARAASEAERPLPCSSAERELLLSDRPSSPTMPWSMSTSAPLSLTRSDVARSLRLYTRRLRVCRRFFWLLLFRELSWSPSLSIVVVTSSLAAPGKRSEKLWSSFSASAEVTLTWSSTCLWYISSTACRPATSTFLWISDEQPRCRRNLIVLVKPCIWMTELPTRDRQVLPLMLAAMLCLNTRANFPK
mmetsp:Transcript_44239/g.86530  ORF Transcript_44239/g.86530 Transcript_44239/m.86530 type:complete len:215 (+) Transcript_44239:2190-2834(+)